MTPIIDLGFTNIYFDGDNNEYIYKKHKNRKKNNNINDNNKINDNLINYDKNKVDDILRTIVIELEKENNKHIINLKNKINKLEHDIVTLQKRLNAHQTTISVEQQCCVCMIQPKNHANTTCGHMSVCEYCSNRLDNKCPICKQDGIFIRIYSS